MTDRNDSDRIGIDNGGIEGNAIDGASGVPIDAPRR